MTTAAIWCIALAYPGLWASERVRQIRRFSGWARAPLYLGILLFSWSDFATFFNNARTHRDVHLQNLLVAATLLNGLFPAVDVAISSLLRNTHLKLCQPWQWRYPAIHGLFAIPVFYTATSLLVLVLSARSPYLWPDETNGFATPVATVGPALVMFMAVFQLFALALLVSHPALGLPERYEPLAMTNRSAQDPDPVDVLPGDGLLARRFLEQERRIGETQQHASPVAQKHLSTENGQTGTKAQQGKPDLHPNAVAGMDFYESLKSWAALSSVERTQTSNVRILVVTATLLDTVAGWLYFGVTIRLPPGPESCPR